MCGVAAFYRYRPQQRTDSRAQLERMAGRMACRGPDDEGVWIDENEVAGLAHRRLSIIDLSERGAQPMWDNGRSVVISFNGEIYNYRELRRELEGKGYQFVTDSDTEVLIQLYRDRGPDMVRALRGMFAFVIWDPGQRRMLLARDPFGIKPLYFADDGNTIRVASEVKAL